MRALTLNRPYRLEVRDPNCPTAIFGSSKHPIVVFKHGVEDPLSLTIDYGDTRTLTRAVRSRRRRPTTGTLRIITNPG